MTIDEAIEHAKRVAASCEGECADNHRQLVEWLRELVMLRKIVALRDDATWQAIHEYEELKAKNAQLKAKADAQWSHIKKLQAELSHCIEKSSRDYDRDLDRRRRLATENAKLRELVRDMWRDGMCDCDEYGACAKCEYGYLDRMRELGIEESYERE